MIVTRDKVGAVNKLFVLAALSGRLVKHINGYPAGNTVQTIVFEHARPIMKVFTGLALTKLGHQGRCTEK